MQRSAARMTGVGLDDWITRHGLTRTAAAARLGISPRTLYGYLSDTRKMSRTMSLLIRALDELWKREAQS